MRIAGREPVAVRHVGAGMKAWLALMVLSAGAAQAATTPQASADYWRLLPYYRPQISDSACSVASAAMALAALGAAGMDQPTLLATDAAWSRDTVPGGDGVSFGGLLAHLRQGLMRAGLGGARLTVFHPADTSPRTLARLRRLLAAAASDDGDVVLVSFDQGWLWGEPSVGHISPVGDYDAASGRVLIMDVDGEHFGPLWLADTDLLAAMTRADDDPDGVVVIRR